MFSLHMDKKSLKPPTFTMGILYEENAPSTYLQNSHIHCHDREVMTWYHWMGYCVSWVAGLYSIFCCVSYYFRLQEHNIPLFLYTSIYLGHFYKNIPVKYLYILCLDLVVLFYQKYLKYKHHLTRENCFLSAMVSVYF